MVIQDSRGPTVGNPSADAVPGTARNPASRIVPCGHGHVKEPASFLLGSLKLGVVELGRMPGPHHFLEVTIFTGKGGKAALFYFKPLWRVGVGLQGPGLGVLTRACCQRPVLPGLQ